MIPSLSQENVLQLFFFFFAVILFLLLTGTCNLSFMLGPKYRVSVSSLIKCAFT